LDDEAERGKEKDELTRSHVRRHKAQLQNGILVHFLLITISIFFRYRCRLLGRLEGSQRALQLAVDTGSHMRFPCDGVDDDGQVRDSKASLRHGGVKVQAPRMVGKRRERERGKEGE
jgi:hypothetical protein